MNGLQARLVRHVDSPDGPQADVALVEPNGDESEVRCLCRLDGTTDLGEVGDGSLLKYLSDKYGGHVVLALACRTTLGHS